MTTWTRQRHPDDVPTPVAVALADFCRRAEAPASALEVRHALSLLSAGDDDKVAALAARAPEACPLGPYAVVDVLHGASPLLASQRQVAGAYQALVEQSAVPVPLPARAPLGQRAASEVPAPEKRPSRKRKGARELPAAVSVRDPSAPKVRALPPPAPPASSFLPRRVRPPPRGRFTTIDPTRASLEALRGEGARAEVKQAVADAGHRFRLWHRWTAAFVGHQGRPLSLAEVEELVAGHGLAEELAGRERDALLQAFQQHRGARARVAQALELSREQLTSLVRTLSLGGEVEQIRERFRRDALAAANLGPRLQLASKRKYLEDLDIAAKFDAALKRDLQELLAPLRPLAPTEDAVLELAARRTALPLEHLRQAHHLLGLSTP